MKHTLHVEEYNFFSEAVRVFCPDEIFPSIFEFNSVNNECVVIANISFHEFNRLSEFLIIVEPGENWRCQGDNTTREFDTLSFVTEGTLRFDDKSWSCLSTI